MAYGDRGIVGTPIASMIIVATGFRGLEGQLQ